MSEHEANELVFEGVGTVNLEPPPEGLRPLFERKFKTTFRNAYNPTGKQSLGQEEMEHFAWKTSANVPTKKERLELFEQMKNLYRKTILCDKDSITEERFVQAWMRRAFGDVKEKKQFAEQLKAMMRFSFETVDTNKNGFIDKEEFHRWYSIRGAGSSTAQMVFDAIDKDSDGQISLDEWIHGAFTNIFTSGAEDPLTLWHGPLVD